MSMTEALRVQLDNAERAKQQLEAENARLRDEHPEEAALVDTRSPSRGEGPPVVRESTGAGAL